MVASISCVQIFISLYLLIGSGYSTHGGGATHGGGYTLGGGGGGSTLGGSTLGGGGGGSTLGGASASPNTSEVKGGYIMAMRYRHLYLTCLFYSSGCVFAIVSPSSQIEGMYILAWDMDICMFLTYSCRYCFYVQLSMHCSKRMIQHLRKNCYGKKFMKQSAVAKTNTYFIQKITIIRLFD